MTFELEEGFNTIGRNPTNDLRLRDATVSSFHCEVVVKQDAVVVRDLGSSNGTFVNGQLVQESRLEPGATLRLGSFELKLERHEDAGSVRISIPPLARETPVSCGVLADGRCACVKHPNTAAAFECTRCHECFCSACVRVLALGGNTRVFCPRCSGQCDSLPVPPGVETTPAKKTPSILGRLSQTIRIRLK